MWTWPLKNRTPLLPDSPGAFGAIRRCDVHTGVDLYCQVGTEVVACEDGEVISIQWFTGQYAAVEVEEVDEVSGERRTVLTPSHWWNDTISVLVRGASGVIVYGELTCSLSSRSDDGGSAPPPPRSTVPMCVVGRHVKAGELLGHVHTSVLRVDKGRPMTMLHLELMEAHCTDSASTWQKPAQDRVSTVASLRPQGLLDPTTFLMEAAVAALNQIKNDTGTASGSSSGMPEATTTKINSESEGSPQFSTADVAVFSMATYDGVQFKAAASNIASRSTT